MDVIRYRDGIQKKLQNHIVTHSTKWFWVVQRVYNIHIQNLFYSFFIYRYIRTPIMRAIGRT